MAITIRNGQPGQYQSLQDDIWWIVESDNVANTDFKYVFDIYVGGVLKTRIKQYPEPSNDYGYCNVANVVRNSMLYNSFNVESNAYEPSMSVTYEVKFGEEYGGSTYLNLDETGNVKAYNFRPDLFNRTNLAFGYTQISELFDLKSVSFLTDRSKTFNVDFNKTTFITYFNSQNSANVTRDIVYYNAYGAVLDTFSATDSSLNVEFLQYSLRNGYNMTVPAGTEYIIFTITNDNDFTDTIRLNKICNPKYETTAVHFMNRWGAFESLHFDLVSRLTMDIERKSFEKRDYKFGNNSPQGAGYPEVTYYDTETYDSDRRINVGIESKINYSNKMNWSYRLTANALNDNDYKWASQLLNSPQIYMEIDSPEYNNKWFYPVTIKATNFEYSKYVNNRQRALEIDFEMNQTRYSHLR